MRKLEVDNEKMRAELAENQKKKVVENKKMRAELVENQKKKALLSEKDRTKGMIDGTATKTSVTATSTSNKGEVCGVSN